MRECRPADREADGTGVTGLLPQPADRIEGAIARVLDEGLRTADIRQDGCRTIGTREMGDAILAALDAAA